MDRIIEKKKWTVKKIAAILAGAAFLTLIVYMIFFRDHSSKLNVEFDQLIIATVKKDKFQEFIPVDGIVHPIRTVYLDAIQGGFVEKVFVEDGAILKEGDTIVKLTNPELEMRYMDSESRIVDGINNLQNSRLSIEQTKFTRQKEILDLSYRIDEAKRDYDRKKQFHSENVIADEEFEIAERDYKYFINQKEIAIKLQRIDSIQSIRQIKQINLSEERMIMNLQMLKSNLSNLYVLCPVEGQISNFSLEIGETIGTGENIGRIDILDGYKIRANIDERYITRVFDGQEAEFDFAGTTFQLQISKIYTEVSNGSFQVDLKFPDQIPENLRRGQTLQLRLKFSSPTDAIIVKRGGFFQKTGGNWIYIVDPSGNFATKRDIRIGRQNTNHYEVLEGLEPGEQVIISSYDSFGDKDKLMFER